MSWDIFIVFLIYLTKILSRFGCCWCVDPPKNFKPRFFIQIMLKTKVVRWILYPYSSYFLAIFKDLEKSNRISQNTGTGVGEIHPFAFDFFLLVLFCSSLLPKDFSTSSLNDRLLFEKNTNLWNWFDPRNQKDIIYLLAFIKLNWNAELLPRSRINFYDR